MSNKAVIRPQFKRQNTAFLSTIFFTAMLIVCNIASAAPPAAVKTTPTHEIVYRPAPRLG